MPELPEVEVTRRQLEPLLVGREVRSVSTTRSSYFFLTRPAVLRRRLPGQRFVSLERIGKYLLAGLDSGDRLLLHLGMTGQLFGSGAASVRLLRSAAAATLPPERQRSLFHSDPHTHLRLSFADSGPDVLFRDVRKFGKVQLLTPTQTSPRLDRLGPDALRARGSELYHAARRRRTPIKTLLLDQSVLAGVGNIYADEALNRAGIRPARPAQRLSPEECAGLVGAVKAVLRRAISTGGSSISDYVHPDGEDGRYQDERRVYARTGEGCLECGTVIRRVVLAGRSSHFCPRCQR